MSTIEVDIFQEDVDNPDHPIAESFKKLLEEVAEQYRCHLMTFEMKKGTATFSFDNDLLTADILKILAVEDAASPG